MTLGAALRHLRNGSIVVLVLAGATTVFVRPADAADPVPGSAGTDTSLPLTESAATVRGRGVFADLAVTVNQTADLVNQAISVTWEGGTPTKAGATPFDGHYLQIMQCWGDDDGAVPSNPGPPPEQCVQGATDAVYGGRVTALFGPGNGTVTRVIARRDLPTYDPEVGELDERTGLVWRPFRAVDGTTIGVQVDPTFNPAIVGGNYWLNPYFNVITTNEVPGAKTRVDGRGAELFEVATGIESSGLGCGQKVQPVAGGGLKEPQCWLVVVPRGDPAVENAGLTPNPAAVPVFTSPVSERAWRNRIAIPLEFSPVDSSCELTDDQRRLAGSEHASGAISSWQRSLCSDPALSPFSYGTLADTTAREQLLAGGAAAPGMVVVSRPVDPAVADSSNPVVYAPLTVSGTVIGFNLERTAKPGIDPAEDALNGVRVANLNLTPRLVAKLLTQSYRLQTSIKYVRPPYEWVRSNPGHLGLDPDFVQFNPEFALLDTGGKNMAGLVLPVRGSDAARQLWEWVLADPEAKAWLDGAADPWGMVVNPVYATTVAKNSTGVAFGSPTPETYPKSDPYCYQGPARGPGGSITPPPLCGTDWLPYAQSLRDAARLARAADDGARTNEDPNATSAEVVYKADGPQLLGSRAIMSLTDSASAQQYGLQTARLSRAGDNGPDRRFIAPDRAGLVAALPGMRPGAEPTVLEPDATATAPGGYPLTVVTYAAITPLAQDAPARAEYAAFVEYAAGAGQAPGHALGQLPPGYAPLSDELVAQARAAAARIRTLRAPVPPAATPPIAGPSAGPAGPAGPLPPAAPTDVAQGPALVPDEAPTSEPSAPAVLTPLLALAANRYALPAIALVALLSALASLEITKRPRRVSGAASNGASSA